MPDVATSPPAGGVDDLRRRVSALMIRDERALARRVERIRRSADRVDRDRVRAGVERDLERAESRVAARRASVPAPIEYPAELPVVHRAGELAEVIREHQVVVIAGETGSGKTTQLPKICLDLGRGVRGMIGHTQPRRIAARSVAERIAEELGRPLGTTVGYQVRFSDHTGDETLLKVMTDGILLAEITRDRDLLRYDTIIVDEAHERSLTIDFLLGYLAQLLPRRPDLKVLITSATIDPHRFAAHFGGAPVVEVSGRTYPVEVRYRPLTRTDDAEPRDQVSAVCDAVDELATEGRGDVLVFCSGEREIRDTAEALRGRRLPETEILPLYSRLSAAEQHRVFARHPGRRIVLATNVAETSITVPGIRYVVDPGTARISRYSRRLKVQRLPIEPVSRASADQRAGRCGRVAAGICIRLYTEEDYLARPAFTDPEILRTNLASVILQMAALDLGEMADFGFVDPPDTRDVADGVRLLTELSAFVDTPTGLRRKPGRDRRRLSPTGRLLAGLPLDPRIARMVVQANELGCLREVLIIAAGLTIADPRERPLDRQQAADTSHRRFATGPAADSDFLSLLTLWDYLRDRRKELSGSAFRRMCTQEFLHYLRIREWQDLEAQLRSTCKELVFDVPRDRPGLEGRADLVHQALLTGLLGLVGLRDGERREYLGARGAWFSLSPGSVLFRRQPPWVMAADLVETTRLWAHTAARIDPAWLERYAGHLLKRTYSEPHWSRRQAAVMAYERATLYGIPVVTGRLVTYSSIDPQASRELFLRHALVEGDWDNRHDVLAANRAMLERVGELEERTRRRGMRADDETLLAFYDARVPAQVVSGRHFDTWWTSARREQPDLLAFTEELVLGDRADDVDAEAYPTVWRSQSADLPVEYAFEPGSPDDGVRVEVPLGVLPALRAEQFGWQIPALREELVTALIRSLPKNLRRLLVPAADTARRELADGLDPGSGSLTEALAPRLTRRAGRRVSASDFDLTRVPDRLRVSFDVVDDTGRRIDQDKDLRALQRRLAGDARERLGVAAADVERSGLRAWTFGEVPTSVDRPGPGGSTLTGYPALVDEGASVAIRVLESPELARQATWAGQRRLLVLGMPSPVRQVLGRLDNATKLALGRSSYPRAQALMDDAVLVAVDAAMAEHGAPVADAAGFSRLRDQVAGELVDRVAGVLGTVARILAAAHALAGRLEAPGSAITEPSLADMRAQLARLSGPGFVARAGAARLPDVLRYLRAIEFRYERVAGSGGRDLVKLERIRRLDAELARVRALVPAGMAEPESVQVIGWMLEELRTSEFAQSMRGRQPVSEKRIEAAIQRARAEIDALR